MKSALALVIILFTIQPVLAHWKYPEECCSGRDCKEVDASRVETTTTGYLIDKRYWMQFRDVRESPDDKYHVCIATTAYWSRLRCLFVPRPRVM